MSDLERLIESISAEEVQECQENLRINFEEFAAGSRMNMIAFD